MLNTASTSETERSCPGCGAAIPIHKGYISWCEKCGWNLKPDDPLPTRNLVTALYRAFGEQHSRALFERLARAKSLQPALTLQKVLAFGLAGGLNGLSVLLGLMALLALLYLWPSPCACIAVLVLVWIAFTLRPRPVKLDVGDVTSRYDYPALYELSDRVAGALHISGADVIAIDSQFRADYRELGWRRKRVLYLGLPLLSVLNSREQVALLAHALAGSLTADPSRNWFFSMATDGMARWYEVMRPEQIWGDKTQYDLPMDKGFQYNPADPTFVARQRAAYNLFALPVKMIQRGIAAVIWFYAYLLTRLLWPDTQRAQYEADSLAASVAGTDATLSMLLKSHFGGTFQIALEQAFLRQDAPYMFDDLRYRMSTVPEREMARISRVGQLPATQSGSEQPPTPYRVAMLQFRPITSPTVALEPGESERINQELVSVQTRVQAKALSDYDPDRPVDGR